MWINGNKSKYLEISNTEKIIISYFPEINYYSEDQLKEIIKNLSNLSSTKPWSDYMNYLINSFTGRIVDWNKHVWSIYWIIDLIKFSLSNDIIKEYETYLNDEMRKLVDPIVLLLSRIINEKEKYPKVVIKKLSEYIDTLEKQIKILIEIEMDTIKNYLWLKDDEQNNSRFESFRTKLLKIIKP